MVSQQTAFHTGTRVKDCFRDCDRQTSWFGWRFPWEWKTHCKKEFRRCAQQQNTYGHDKQERRGIAALSDCERIDFRSPRFRWTGLQVQVYLTASDKPCVYYFFLVFTRHSIAAFADKQQTNSNKGSGRPSVDETRKIDNKKSNSYDDQDIDSGILFMSYFKLRFWSVLLT